MTKGIRVGDVVAVSARVVGLKGDGSYSIEPMGFDFELSSDGSMHHGNMDIVGDDELAEKVDVAFFTVDEPKLLKHTWMKGDRFAGPWPGPVVYERALGEGIHLLNLPEEPQHKRQAWVVLTTQEVDTLTPEEPPQSD